jgi:rhodanese-related sulfurtransferase
MTMRLTSGAPPGVACFVVLRHRPIIPGAHDAPRRGAIIGNNPSIGAAGGIGNGTLFDSRVFETMREPKRTILEMLVIGAVGVGIALAANHVNPDRLSLTRNYFEKKAPPPPPPPPPDDKDGTEEPNRQYVTDFTVEGFNEQQLVDHIENELGYQAVTQHEMVELVEDPFYQDGIYIVIDARREDFYAQGHIPGAYSLYSMRLDKYEPDYLATLLQLCQGAEKVVVYCNGGKCEDSEFTASDLSDLGVGWDRLYIYPLGFTGWSHFNLPVEHGERNSGDITGGTP